MFFMGTATIIAFCFFYVLKNPTANIALTYILAVFLVARFTDGYSFGLFSSFVGVVCVNFLFTYPYFALDFTMAGYPITFVAMFSISSITSAITSNMKTQARVLAEREKMLMEAEKEKMRANLLRAISHDLRTPLTAISGAAAVLLSSEEPRSEKDVSLLNDINNDAEALTTMVENLLSITRIQDASVPLKKREEMLEEVAGDAVLTTRRRFPDANVQLDLSEDILFLPMEPMLIKQVIVNLLENAVRHSGDTQHIQLHLFRQEEWAVVEVRDHGIGLSPDIMQAVQSGRPLPRDLSGDSTRGMGIGLSVCQSIIKAHGGFFAAGNDPEGGAVFRFGLPMEEKAYE